MSDDDLIRRGDALAAIRSEAWPEDGTYPPEQHDIQEAERATVEVCEAAIAALPAVTVGVKPLVWRSNGKGRVCADTSFGLYEIEHGRYGMRLLHSGSFMQDDLQGIDAAKAAAQADYEARIMAALEPVAAPDPAAIREAALMEAADFVDTELMRWGFPPSDGCRRDDMRTAILALIQKGAADDRA